MFSRRQFAFVPGLIAGAAMAKTVFAQSSTQPESPEREKNLAAGEVEAKRLLLLMDKDQNGKVSREEFMKFMQEEFDRMDKNRDGELDVKELTQSRFYVHGGASRR